MDPRRLGDTDLYLSPIGLGTVKFGRNQGVKYPEGFALPDDAALADLLALAKDLGINTLDTAPAYGSSEERLGSLLAGQRQDWVIVGKAGEDFVDGESSHDFSPAHIRESLERSLKRLKTDYIDVLLLHSDGSDLDILLRADLMAVMQDFKDEGKVRAIGASTKTVEGGIKSLDLMDVAMCAYNPLYQDEEPVLDHAAAQNKGILLKKILASGHVDDFNSEDPVQDAMDFVFAHPGVTSAIIGTINPEHLKSNVEKAQRAIATEPRHPMA